ncbi:MAG: PqqD family protein [Nitrospirota bacterium]
MLEINDSDVFILSEDYSLYNVELKEKKYWLFNVKDGGNFKLNEVSYYILSRCDGKSKVEEIKKELVYKYNIDKEVVIKDFEEFAADCLFRKIIKKI